MKPLRIGDISVSLPIIQGGMGVGISLSGLASSVANEGGVGVIAAAMIGMGNIKNKTDVLSANVNALKSEINKFREKSKGILGVNIMVALTDFGDMVKTAIEEKVDIIFSGAGLPLDLPKYLIEGAKTKLVPIVSSAKAAKILCMKWLSKFNYLPDAIVVEGPKAGGHLGFKPEQINDPEYSLEKIVPRVIEIAREFELENGKKIPVIAAGGIYTGEDILKFINMGASGVQMATSFVATHECDADIEFKKAYINAKEEDVAIIKSPVGMPGRAIMNGFIKDVIDGAKKIFKCPYHCIQTCEVEKSPYCIAQALINAKKGKLQNGFAFAGSNVYKIKEIVSVHDLIEKLKSEYERAKNNLKKTI